MATPRRAVLAALVGAAALGLGACTSSGYPADPEGTLDRISGGPCGPASCTTRPTWTPPAPSPSAASRT